MAIAINVKPSSGAGKAQSLVLQKGVNRIHVSAGDALQLADTLSQQLPADAVMQRSADTLIIEIPSQGIRAELDGFYAADASGAGATIEFPAVEAGAQVTSFGAESLSSLTLDAASGGASGGNGGGAAHSGISTTGLVIGGVLVAGAAAAAASGSSSKTSSVAVPVPVPTPVPTPVPAPAPAPLAVSAITPSASSVNEGGTVTVSIATNQTSGSISYVLSGTAGASDVAGGSLTGSATIGADGVATFQVATVADQSTEGSESLVVTAGGKSATITINDTSLTPAPVAKTATLTAGIDTFVGTDLGDTLTLAGAGGGLTGLDNLDGGAGTDSIVLNADSATTIAAAASTGYTVKSFENLTANTVGGLTASTVGWGDLASITSQNVASGSTSLTVDKTTSVTSKDGAGSVTIAGGARQDATAKTGVVLSGAVGAVKAVVTTGGANSTIDGGTSVDVTTTTATSDTLKVGNSAGTSPAPAASLPTGAVTLVTNVTSDGLTAGAITVVGGTTVSVTENLASTANGSSITGGAVSVTGSAATTSVTVNQTAAVTRDSEKADVEFTALLVGQSVTVAGLTLTATGYLSSQAVANAFASLSDAALAGNATTGTWTGQLSGWGTGAAAASGSNYKVTATATAYGNVTNIATAVGGSSAATAPVVVTVDGTASVAETAAVTFSDMKIGQTVTVGGLTYTAKADATGAQVAADFVAGLATGTTYGDLSGTLVGWANPSLSSATVTYTSGLLGNVTNLTASAATLAPTALKVTTTDGTAAKTVTDGAVTIYDANSSSVVAPSTISTVSLSNFGAADVKSSALTSVTLAGTGTSFTQGKGSFQGAAAATETLTLNAAKVTGAVSVTGPTTLTIATGGTAASSVGPDTATASTYLTATGVTTLNIAAAQNLTVSGAVVASSATAINLSGTANISLSSTGSTSLGAANAVITSTSTGAVKLNSTLQAGQSYAGGSGADTISVASGGTAAITTGAGDDVITYNGPLNGGSIDAGAGTDTIVMTAANAATATLTSTFAGTVAGFEVMSLSAATGVATAIDMGKAAGINVLKTVGSTTGALAISNAAAGFTLYQGAASTAAIGVTLADASGTSDTVNLYFAATDGFSNGTNATTVTGVEKLNIFTADTDTKANSNGYVANISDSAAVSVVVSGTVGFKTSLDSAAITSFDASGLNLSGTTAVGTLDVTFTGSIAGDASVKGTLAGVNKVTANSTTTASKITYVGGSGADTVSLGSGSHSVSTGAGKDNITTGSGNDTIDAGADNDTISSGAGLDLIYGGSGNDTFVITSSGNMNIYSTILDEAAGDILKFGTAAISFTAAKVNLAATATFGDYLDLAAAGTANSVKWFQFGGDTYVVGDLSAGSTFTTTDAVVKLSGLHDLSTSLVGSSFVSGTLTNNLLVLGG